MRKTLAISGILLVLLICGAIASQRPAPYSVMVKWITDKQNDVPVEPVYIWPWVKTSGAYPIEKNKTIDDLVKSAGGFIRDERLKNIPSLYVLPDRVCVYRPTKKAPDPTEPMFVFSLDWTKSDGDITNCTFQLQEMDLVTVNMK